MKKVFTFLLVLNLGTFTGEVANANLMHPFFVSVTEINHNAKSKSLEISCKMFYDDLQIALRQLNKKTVDLSNKKNEAENDKLLQQYLADHLVIVSDSKTISLKYLGFEIEKESVYCYFEAENISTPKKVSLTNKILQDYKSEQVNIMHFVVNGNRKSTKTDAQNPQSIITF